MKKLTAKSTKRTRKNQMFWGNPFSNLRQPNLLCFLRVLLEGKEKSKQEIAEETEVS